MKKGSEIDLGSVLGPFGRQHGEESDFGGLPRPKKSKTLAGTYFGDTFEKFSALGALLAAVGPTWGAPLDASLGRLGAVFADLGSVWGRLEIVLGQSFGHLGASWFWASTSSFSS